MSLLLGIDGGGLKSTAAVSDGNSVLGTGASRVTLSRAEVMPALDEAVRGALSAAGVSASAVGSVCAGVAGTSSSEHAALVAALLREMLPKAKVQVVGDTVIALESAFPGGPGVVCMAGAGSIAFGRNERGETARAGGWGSLVSDEGSSNWIGQRAVSQCLRALDMGRSSQLIEAIMTHWGIVTREQMVLRCQQERQTSFSELFPLVLQVAEAGDPLGADILTAAGTELARMTQIVLRRLWVGHCPVEIALAGNIFAHSRHVRQIFTNFIRSERPEVGVRINQQPPVTGALYLAQRALPGDAGAAG